MGDVAPGQATPRIDTSTSRSDDRPFVHSAMLYDGPDEFLDGTVRFLEEGLDAGEPAMVSVHSDRLRPLAEAMGPAAGSMIRFVPMEDLGRNPAWIIPAWAEFVGPHLDEGRAVRGIGEPIWAGRSDDELVECARHESLLNVAMAGAAGFSLLCPYDVGALDHHVVTEACHNHPELRHDTHADQSKSYRHDIPTQLSDPLPPPPDGATSVAFHADDAWAVRRDLARAATEAGLDGERLEDLAVAVSESLSNSIEHGGGEGEILWWTEPERFLCEIRDRGTIPDPLVGRVKPSPLQGSGRGMWLVHQLCDLVQIRVLPDDTKVIRLHLSA